MHDERRCRPSKQLLSKSLSMCGQLFFFSGPPTTNQWKMVKEDSSTILATEQLRHKQVKNLIASNSTPKYEKRKRGKSADRGKQEILLSTL